jgi:hypothetical protein
MQSKRNTKETGNVLIYVMGVIVILSVIGAIVLRNSTTRLNASSNQVRAWKEALSAAETGGDIAFAEIRKKTNQWTGWTPSPTGHGYVSPPTTFGSSNLMAQTVVEKFYFDTAVTPPLFTLGERPGVTSWYRLRSKGTAPLPNLKRTGMDDALIKDGLQHFAPIGSTAMQDITARGNGDSLLRKIDFQYDHFVATYGPNGDGVGKIQVTATLAPSISRRIEQIVTPVTPFFDAAIKCAGDFYGLGSAAMFDSYDSRRGHYYFCADNAADAGYPDSRHASLQIGSATATIKGMLYGDVATNGGNIVGSSQITGTIDNNVPFTLDPYVMPSTSTWVYVPPPILGLPPGPGQLPAAVTGTNSLTPPARLIGAAGGTVDTPTYYRISSLSGALTVNPTLDPISGNPVDTYVAIRVLGGGDITGGITVNGGTPDPTNPDKATGNVHLKIYFGGSGGGSIITKTSNLNNHSPTATNPYAGNLQFYGISPPAGTTQTIALNPGPPPGYPMAATFYAPGADASYNGNSDFIGTMVCKTFYGNGNVSWHFDRALNGDGEPLDFRIASYIEDTR